MQKSLGFTLIELMFTLVVMVVLLGVGGPAMIDMFQTNRLATESNRILSAMALARGEAIRLQTPTAVCASNNANSRCPTGNSARDRWDRGWHAIVDIYAVNANTTGSYQNNGSTRLDRFLRHWEPAYDDYANRFYDLVGNERYARFLPDGSLDATTDFVLTMTPTDCPTGLERIRVFTVAQTGRTNVAKSACP